MWYGQTGNSGEYNTVHAVYLRLQTHHTQYAIIIAFPLQQWLHERASMFRYMYIGCLLYLQPAFFVSTKQFKRSETNR